MVPAIRVPGRVNANTLTQKGINRSRNRFFPTFPIPPPYISSARGDEVGPLAVSRDGVQSAGRHTAGLRSALVLLNDGKAIEVTIFRRRYMEEGERPPLLAAAGTPILDHASVICHRAASGECGQSLVCLPNTLVKKGQGTRRGEEQV